MSNLTRLLRRLGAGPSGLLLSAVYLVVWVPAGLAARVLGADWLRRRSPRASNWSPRDVRVNAPRHLTELF
ncbi:MAG: hypothetical protein A3C53_04315 [Omnitrophica WOR_2 bacterium RIFCSPHIGHO2_02_FULL_68_15]|nr:MAG: hypothetical protein A3C53_04315 [Omnitrophica WOR_2 bacterium RIFCSPHIGHO2_02_FULL_68_15]